MLKITLLLISFFTFVNCNANHDFCLIEKVYYSNETCEMSSYAFDRMIKDNDLCINGALLGFYQPTGEYIFFDHIALSIVAYKNKKTITEKNIIILHREKATNIKILEVVLKDNLIIAKTLNLNSSITNILILTDIEEQNATGQIYNINEPICIIQCDLIHIFKASDNILFHKKLEYIISSKAMHSEILNYTQSSRILKLEQISPFQVNIATEDGRNIPYLIQPRPNLFSSSQSEVGEASSDFLRISKNTAITILGVCLVIMIIACLCYAFRKFLTPVCCFQKSKSSSKAGEIQKSPLLPDNNDAKAETHKIQNAKQKELANISITQENGHTINEVETETITKDETCMQIPFNTVNF